MLTLETARLMAANWCEAWNRRDLDAIMAHYSEDVAFRSPNVIARWGVADGWLHGRTRLRENFARVLELARPHFTLLDVMLGVDAMCVLYRRETGDVACNLVELDPAGQARRVVACHGATSAGATSVGAAWGTAQMLPQAVAHSEISEVSVEADLLQRREAIWAVLTRPALIARWLLPNDFAPVAGHRFSFQASALGNWDGVIRCEVLEVEGHHRLSYRWIASGDAVMRNGIAMTTIVSWTLADAAKGTRLRLVHAGYHTQVNDAAYRAMNPEWQAMFAEIARLAGELDKR